MKNLSKQYITDRYITSDFTYSFAKEFFKEFTEITFEQFKQYVLKEQDMKKIIGYKTPMELFTNSVVMPIGTTFSVTNENPDFYCAKEGVWINESYWLPKEIVETWEPVYREESKVGDWVIGWHSDYGNCKNKAWQITYIGKDDYIYMKQGPTHKNNVRKATLEEIEAAQSVVLTLGTKNDTIDISKGSIEVCGKKYDITSLQEVYRYFNETYNVKHYNFYIPDDMQCLRIGCSDEDHRFSLDEILTIINKYKTLNP